MEARAVVGIAEVAPGECLGALTGSRPPASHGGAARAEMLRGGPNLSHHREGRAGRIYLDI